MKLEHTGITVSDPYAFADWYCQHLGFRVARQHPTSPFTTFLADPSGSVLIEVYRHPQITLFDYASLDPLLLHFAFEVGDEPIQVVAERLMAAGATMQKELTVIATGDQLIMLRDPWGLALQLVHREPRLI